MKKTFELNGKKVVAKDFDFNMVCEFEDMGISLSEAANKPMKMVRAYVAMCLDESLAESGEKIQKHLIGGGTFEEIINVMGEKMNESDFFRAISQNENKTA